MPFIRVYLCDDVAPLRLLVRYALEEHDDLVVVGEAGDALAGIPQIAELRPDVVVLDLSMPGKDGLQALPEILAAVPGVAVVIFSGYATDLAEARAHELGAVAFVEKGAPLGTLVQAVRDAAGS